ncbi:MAG: Septum formation protein Maf [Chloroflexi bacterium]|jgi:septum formation protein|nr:Septum formation protein Maf [Chloroflexota bacterium]
MPTPIVLASSSPRRHALLRYLGVPFSIDPSTIDETPTPGALPIEVALSLAERKANDVAQRHPNAVVIGADTLVDLDGRILNKPIDAEDARRMLRELTGNTHQVHSGIAVWRNGRTLSRVVSSTVNMRPASEETIAAYVAGGEPLDKAGAYAAQGEGAALITGVEGSYLAVVGLPLLVLRELLLDAGVDTNADLAVLERLERGELDS